MAAKLFALAAVAIMISLCDSRHLHFSEEQRHDGKIVDLHTHSQRKMYNVNIANPNENQGYGGDLIWGENHALHPNIMKDSSNRMKSHGVNEDRSREIYENSYMRGIENQPPEHNMWPKQTLEYNVNLDNPRKRQQNQDMQLRWNNLKSRKMQLGGSSENSNSNESLEIRKVPLTQHNSSWENTGKGRQVVNHSRPRNQHTALEKDSQEIYNNIRHN